MTASAPTRLEILALPGIPLIAESDDLVAALGDAVLRVTDGLQDGDVVVVAQKIVSKSEGRLVRLREVEPSARARELAVQVDKDPRLVEVILSESDEVVRAKPGVLVVAHKIGVVLANAGVDHSNVRQEDPDGEILLLPVDPDESAERLRAGLAERFGCAPAVVISDSLGRPFRLGTTGVAIGVAGIAALWDLRGEHDLFGEELRVSEVGHADELAAATSIVIGQAAEGIPAALVRGNHCPAPPGKARDLVRPRELDMFR